MVKHGEIAEPLLASFGQPAANALKSVSSQNARRLAMLADGGELTQICRNAELLEIVGKYGDRAADFVWKHKGALTITATLAAFVANLDPFLNGVTDIAKVGAENTCERHFQMPFTPHGIAIETSSYGHGNSY